MQCWERERESVPHDRNTQKQQQQKMGEKRLKDRKTTKERQKELAIKRVCFVVFFSYLETGFLSFTNSILSDRLSPHCLML